MGYVASALAPYPGSRGMGLILVTHSVGPQIRANPGSGGYPQNGGPESEQYIGGLNDSHNDLAHISPQKGVPNRAQIPLFGTLLETSYWGVHRGFKRLS